MLGFLALYGYLLLLYRHYVAAVYYRDSVVTKTGDCERVKTLQQMRCQLYPFVLLDGIKGRTGCFSVVVAQIRCTKYIGVSLVLCYFVFYFHIHFDFVAPWYYS